MALEMNDLMALKSMENGMSPYEQFKTQHMQAKSHTSGIGVAGLVLGTVGTAAADDCLASPQSPPTAH